MKLLGNKEYYNLSEAADILCIDRGKLRWFLTDNPVQPVMIGKFRHWDTKGIRKIEELYWFKKRGVKR